MEEARYSKADVLYGLENLTRWMCDRTGIPRESGTALLDNYIAEFIDRTDSLSEGEPVGHDESVCDRAVAVYDNVGSMMDHEPPQYPEYPSASPVQVSEAGKKYPSSRTLPFLENNS